MNRDRLDRWARLVDLPATRRATLGTVGGGVLAALLAAPVRARGATPGSTPCPAATPAKAREIALAYFDAFNAGDVDALDALLAPDYAHQGALVTEQDRELHKRRLLTNRAAFPDGRYELQDIVAEGDLVAVRHLFTGTLQGEYAGAAPAGQPVAVRGVHIHRVECGRIAETWNSGDALGLLRQIGALPGGPAARTPTDVAGATPAPASPAAGCPPATAEESARIARRWTEEALDRHDLAALDEIVAPDVVHHAGLFVDEVGLPALKADLAALLVGFPDARFTADVVVAEGDRAVVRWTGHGTHAGAFLGLNPTGVPVVFTGINAYRIACGKIVEGWSEVDGLGLLRQLGAVPQPATPAAATPAA